MGDWTLWAERRPTDVAIPYRWRIPARQILGIEMRPEWTDKLRFVGMGCADNEWWPGGSHWDGYRRTVPAGLEWRPVAEGDAGILWGGMDLLPCPFTGQQPRVGYHGRWIGAMPYDAEYLNLESWMVRSTGWRDARAMRDTWNRRHADRDAEVRRAVDEEREACALALDGIYARVADIDTLEQALFEAQITIRSRQTGGA